MPQSPTPQDETARIEPEVFSDDTRPVPRDRGPVGPETAHPPAAAPAATPEAPAAAAEPAPPAAPVEDGETQDIRFAPGEAPGQARPPAAGPADTAAASATSASATSATGVPPTGAAEPGTGPAAERDGTAPSGDGSGTPPGVGPADGPGNGAGGEPPAADAPPRRPWWRRPALVTPVAAVGVLAAAYGIDLLTSSGDVPRNTVVAGVDIGGLSTAAASERLQTELAPRVTADHVVVADDVEATLSPATAGITLDVDGTVDAADDQPLNPWSRLATLFGEREVAPVITGEETALAAQIDAIAEQVDRAPVDASIAVEGAEARIVEPEDGRTLDRAGAADAVTAALASGGDPSTPIELPVDVTEVVVDAAEAQRVLDTTVTPGLAAPVTVSSEDGATSVEIPPTAIAASLTFTPQESGDLSVAVDPARLQEAMGDDFAEFGTPAQDARFELSGSAVSIVPSVDGTGVDPAALAGQLLEVLPQPAPRTVTAQLGAVEAEFSTADAEALGIREQISTFTTNFTSAASGTNIRVGAAEIDGAIVRPGETFSLNGHTGPRGTAQGYVEAGVINNGQFTTAVGGGMSQVATTLFNAVFFAGLEDVYHKPHSYYISRYPAGREATVYYDSIDLEFRNDSSTGVYIDTQWTPSSLTVSFYGTKRYDIESISSNRYNQRQPVVQEKPDDGSCSPQGGSTGFDITVTRVFKDPQSGAEIRREDFRTRYAAEPVIRCVPVAPAPPAPGPEGTVPAPAPAPGGRRPSRRTAA
ncbi:VanW family protein [Geodermatophilus sabuli]|uniref:Vancomycin resistance protein YoaR, contains peptidoglycan-binding and VanW domains n=1 Tax=Geodermatophilus sabuli TaxID=1564158 RepID=A0A285EAZ9_9ACTN|nr:VanW family protein [Geodermatophilus sabuli]MBB3085424.1 vancomycin resistance protein YoaR [Geodermatophilus sabuli]SNX96150.1 Vancomycin resistance protein YoaR, contains peptidoglycan-binding and VanW domains [Geodermatophilus sabuli]